MPGRALGLGLGLARNSGQRGNADSNPAPEPPQNTVAYDISGSWAVNSGRTSDDNRTGF